jgi:NADH-quinone oxidoreductase subunit J
MNDIFIYIILGLMIVASLLTALIRNTLKAVISLAVASALLTVYMFIEGAPLAAVFELSVCAGLITAIFISTISLTQSGETDKNNIESKKRILRYIYLPIILIIVIAIAFFAKPVINAIICNIGQQEDNIQHVVWHTRKLDIAGQIIIIVAGVFGIVILFKEAFKK